MGETHFTIQQVEKQLTDLGVRRGAALLVHTSFRAVRPIENGPLGLIQALLHSIGNEGTLVMPTMTDGETVFDPKSTPTTDMGITAELFWRQPGVVRSTHPGGSFAAKGKIADLICKEQPLSPPHGLDSPPGRVYDQDGQVLLLGVEQSESTMLHVAESIAKVPCSVAHPCVVLIDGIPRRTMIHETDHCSLGFRKMDPWLRERGLLREGPVGNARAKLAEARDLVTIATGRLAKNPYIFLCAENEGCEECDAARASALQ